MKVIIYIKNNNIFKIELIIIKDFIILNNIVFI